ncbi:MAG: EAL domain-containing protein [Gammaproteobacteria bacterium]|nr:EAL domain-containing protein [Gammaproteobacteria bacterium]
MASQVSQGSSVLTRYLLDHLPRAVLLIDAQGTVLVANRRAAALFGQPLLGIEGTGIDELAFDSGSLGVDEQRSRLVTLPSGETVAWTVSRLIDGSGGVAEPLLVAEESPDPALVGEDGPTADVMRRIIDGLPDIVFGKDDSGRFIYANRAAARALGTTVGELIGRHESELSPALADTGRFRVPDPRAIENLEPVQLPEHVMTDASGIHRVLRTVAMPVGGRGVIGISTDVTEQKRMEGSLRIATEVFERCRESIMVTDPVRCVLFVNPAFTTMTGYGAEEILGRSADTLRSGAHDAAFYAKIWSDVDAVGYWQGCLSSRRKSGEVFDQWLSITAVRGTSGSVERYISIAADITSYKNAQARISYLAQYDGVTGLPNRSLLGERLNAVIAQSEESQDPFSLICIDIDRFNQINTTFGHAVGDLVLNEVAARLLRALPAEATVSRYGGNEFVVLAPTAARERAVRMSESLCAQLERPFSVEGVRVKLTAGAGIATYPAHGRTAAELQKHANLALRHAKHLGRGGVQVFNPSMTYAARERARIEDGLRRALENNDFDLHFQPQIGLDGDTLVGAEALIRWSDPACGPIAPSEFMPVAEDCGLVGAIGDWVLEQVCRQQQAWRAAGLPTVPVAVNVSALQIERPEFVSRVAECLERHRLSGDALCLEITESMLLRQPELLDAAMRRLVQCGVRIALDDFGTGFSSLSYLKQLPVHQLKIDRSFVGGLPAAEHDVAIVRAVLSLAHHLGIEVVAEGVETPSQAKFLADSGCRLAQGFLWSRAVPARQFAEWLRLGHAPAN